MIRKLIIISLGLVLMLNVKAQSNLSEQQVESLILLGHQLEGTFQIQMIDTRALPTVELSLYTIIDQKRDLNKTVYHYINSNMRIMIPSKEAIEKPDFISIERIKYISSNNIENE